MKKQPTGIELPKETINALLNGVDKIMIPIKQELCIDSIENYINWDNEDVAIENYSPLQINGEFYVQEPFFCLKDGVKINSIERKIAYQDDKGSISYEGKVQIVEQLKLDFENPIFMTYEQSRLKDLIPTDIQIKRVQDINVNKDFSTKDKKYFEKFTYHCTTEPINFKRHRGFKEYLKRININYDDNPYVFLYSVSKKDSKKSKPNHDTNNS